MQTETGVATSQKVDNSIFRGNKVLERAVANNRSLFEPFIRERGLNGSVLPAYRKCIKVARSIGIKDKIATYINAIKNGIDATDAYENLFVENFDNQAHEFIRKYILEHSTPPERLEKDVLELEGGNVHILANIL